MPTDTQGHEYEDRPGGPATRLYRVGPYWIYAHHSWSGGSTSPHWVTCVLDRRPGAGARRLGKFGVPENGNLHLADDIGLGELLDRALAEVGVAAVEADGVAAVEADGVAAVEADGVAAVEADGAPAVQASAVTTGVPTTMPIEDIVELANRPESTTTRVHQSFSATIQQLSNPSYKPPVHWVLLATPPAGPIGDLLALDDRVNNLGAILGDGRKPAVADGDGYFAFQVLDGEWLGDVEAYLGAIGWTVRRFEPWQAYENRRFPEHGLDDDFGGPKF